MQQLNAVWTFSAESKHTKYKYEEHDIKAVIEEQTLSVEGAEKRFFLVFTRFVRLNCQYLMFNVCSFIDAGLNYLYMIYA